MLSGEETRELREKKGWTLAQLANVSGVHRLLLGRFEKGTVKRMKGEHQAALKAALSIIGEDTPHTPRYPTPHELPAELCPPPSKFKIQQHSLDDCSRVLADWICSLDPTWGNRLQIMKDERGFNTTQALATCIAYVLEHDLHMVIIKHDALEPSPWRRGEKMECPECHQVYAPKYPGQPFDSNECAEAYRRRGAENLL